jgi:hypothetical protein
MPITTSNIDINGDKSRIMMSMKGYDIMKKPWLNKGESFNRDDRNKLGLRGLIPAGEPKSLETRVNIAMNNLRNKALPLDKYIYLHSIQDSDEQLFYCILHAYTSEVMPYVYTPTVGNPISSSLSSSSSSSSSSSLNIITIIIIIRQNKVKLAYNGLIFTKIFLVDYT